MISTLADALAERGYDTLTAVQKAVSDPDLSASDLLVSAQTGSGKTVGFGLAIAQTLLGDEPRFGPPALPLALIVAPTRELAMQVSRELSWLYGKAGVRMATCIGGMDARTERRALERGAHMVVGTPGRLRDHITRGALDLSDIRAIVLDEADEMLDLGFREDLEFMLGEAPEDRRTLMFSATVKPDIAKLAETYQRDARRISTLSDAEQHSDITYQAIKVDARDSENAIINLLRFHNAPTSIVFANTRAAVARLTARLSNRGFSVVSLSGELSQDERSHALQAVRDGRARVCVATDVAARGIDLPALDLVVHADIPSNTEGLLHRSGRTGRAGRKGLSALIVPGPATKKVARLLRWAKIDAQWTAPPTPEAIAKKDEELLLADTAWTDPANEDETEFAVKVLTQFTPEQIAIAARRLYLAPLSAAEDVAEVSAPAPKEPRAPFGPSSWIALSQGRKDRAEARWLLPLLCRTLNLEKSQIGAIRVLESETFVEIADTSMDGVRSRLGADEMLEGDLTARFPDTIPAEVTAPRKPAPKRDFGDRKPQGKPKGKPYGDTPKGDAKSEKPWKKTPKPKEPWSKPKSKPKGDTQERRQDKPQNSSDQRKGTPKTSFKPKPDGPPSKAKYDRPEKPRGGSPVGKPKGKPTGKPNSYRSGAGDTSQRMAPPKGAKGKTRYKPKPGQDSGSAPPRWKR